MEKYTKLNYSEIKSKSISDFETSFSIKPLERGIANTIGNAIRRTILSSVSSIAPFGIKITGADHEFQTLPSVKEDVVQLILNIKNVRFQAQPNTINDKEVLTISLKSKTGEVRAKDMILPSGIEVVNPEHYIGKTSKNGALEFELFIRLGRGYVSFDKNKLYIKHVQTKIVTKLKSGVIIAVDSDFSPVKNVSYEVKELNSSAPIIEEELILNVKTDGSVDAKDIVAEAANIFGAHIEIMKDLSNLEMNDVFQEAISKEENSKSLSLSLSGLDLSVRSYNSLKRAGFNKVIELSSLTLSELEAIKNLGKKSVQEIIEKLEEHNIYISNGGN